MISETMKPSFVSSAWVSGAHPSRPAPSAGSADESLRRREAGPGLRRRKIFAQYPRNRSRCHRATVSALKITSRLAHAGHELRSATQKVRSMSSSAGRGRSFLSAVTCCRRARFSSTRSARRRHAARIVRGAERDEEYENMEHGAAECGSFRPVNLSRRSLLRPGRQPCVSL